MRFAVLFLVGVIVTPHPGLAQYVLQDVHDPERYSRGGIVLPFVFYSPTYRYGGGLVVYGGGFLQPQTGYYGYVLGSTDGTYGFSLGYDDLQLLPIDRLFLDVEVGYFQDQSFRAYIDGNPAYIGHPAGINDSSKHNYFTKHSNDVYAHIDFKYLLPIGNGRDGSPIARYTLEDGILKDGATGGHGWNPFATGRTYLQLTPFVHDLSLDTPQSTDFHTDENGLRFGIVYDNTDFPLNPSRGNITKLTLSRDFGWFESSEAWTNLSGEFAQFLDLGRSKFFRQQVIGLDFWTSYSPTWEHSVVNGARDLAGAPPFYDGATLGGSERLRAFAENRFWDRAAIYGAAELRLIPDFNPLGKIPILKGADITWMQWVAFAELGRVAPTYSMELFSQLKGDFGFGVRLLANDTVVRFDLAASNEGIALLAGLSQPF
jgi:hypothetical protein